MSEESQRLVNQGCSNDKSRSPSDVATVNSGNFKAKPKLVTSGCNDSKRLVTQRCSNRQDYQSQILVAQGCSDDRCRSPLENVTCPRPVTREGNLLELSEESPRLVTQGCSYDRSRSPSDVTTAGSGNFKEEPNWSFQDVTTV